MSSVKVFCDKKISTVAELEEVYRKLLPQLKTRSILLLEGPAGAGKTTSVQILTKLMGICEVVSPSFGIHHHYKNSQGPAMDHVDLYRLADEDDLESTGFWDLFSQKEALIAIEWADRLNEDMLPLNWQKVRITLSLLENPQERHLKIEI